MCTVQELVNKQAQMQKALAAAERGAAQDFKAVAGSIIPALLMPYMKHLDEIEELMGKLQERIG